MQGTDTSRARRCLGSRAVLQQGHCARVWNEGAEEVRRSEGWGGGFRGTGKEGFQSLWTHLRPFSGAPAHKQWRGRGALQTCTPSNSDGPDRGQVCSLPSAPFKPRHAACLGLSGCSSQVGSLPVLGVHLARRLSALSLSRVP